jgi:hypothetical protein
MNTMALMNELEAASDELEAELFAFAEREDGPGQRAAKEQLLMLLAASMSGAPLTREQALAIIADAGRQTDAAGNKLTARAHGRANGRKVKPEPDLAYNARVGGANRRVNVEVDSDPNAAARHIQELRQADPNGRHVAVIVHPVTGVTLDGLVWDPVRKQARRLSASEVTALQQGRLPRTLIPAPTRGQSNKAVPKRRVRSAKSLKKTVTGTVAKLNQTPRKPRPRPAPQRRKAGSREGELEFVASEFQSELSLGAEHIDVDVPGIPGHNQWFTNSGQARRAALRAATTAGAGYTIAHDPRPSRGQPHYHVLGTDGVRVSGHFFYGRRPPRRILRGRPNRESELEFTARDFELELAGT